jgi:hypothetical protein
MNTIALLKGLPFGATGKWGSSVSKRPSESDLSFWSRIVKLEPGPFVGLHGQIMEMLDEYV